MALYCPWGDKMSIGSRIAEARKNMKLTQVELAQKLGVSKGAIANYENEFCTPKAEMMYKLFEVLHVDANFLYQDDMEIPTPPVSLSPDENRLLSVYRSMSKDGKAKVLSYASDMLVIYQAGECASVSSGSSIA